MSRRRKGANTAQYALKPNFLRKRLSTGSVLRERSSSRLRPLFYGLISTGLAQSYYEQGVRQSFAEAGAGDATAYLAQTGVLPAATTGLQPYLSSRYRITSPLVMSLPTGMMLDALS